MLRTALQLLSCLLLVAARKVKQPHIVLMVADDLGWSDVPWHDARTIAPTLTGLANTGVVLERHYTQSICTPTRSALMTGKYPSRLGLNHLTITAGDPYGLWTNQTILAEYMSDAGYAVHGVGKWHLGFCCWAMTPCARGFDSFYGYYNGHQTYYTHETHDAYDFRYDTKSSDGSVNSTVITSANGTYSTYLYANQLSKVVAMHDQNTPLFLYFPVQSVHSPQEAPQEYVDMYSGVVENEKRKRLLAMVTAMDDSASVLISSLKTAGMWEDTIFVFFSDNGGPITHNIGQSNYPLRGGKYSYWEGGIRSASFLHSPMLQGGIINEELFHVTDWKPTLVHIAHCGIEDNPGCRGPDLGDIDGINQWPAVAGLAPSNRSEFLVNIDQKYKNAALRMGQWKLFSGPPGRGPWPVPPTYDAYDWDEWEDDEEAGPDDDVIVEAMLEVRRVLKVHRNSTSKTTNKSQKIQLYNVVHDPSETVELSAQYPEIVEQMLERLKYHQDRAVEPINQGTDPMSNPGKYFDGVWTPWRETC